MNEEAESGDWGRLYEAAIRFRDLTPWEWMDDDHLFAVRDPETGETAYCVVMGTLGEYRALGAYLGPEGWTCLQRIFHDPDLGDDLLYDQKALLASFEDREDVDSEDRRIMKELGYRFRGRGAWPVFRRHEPARIPRHLKPEEVRFLTVLLEQATELAETLLDEPDHLKPPRRNLILTRSLSPGERGWESTWERTPEPVQTWYDSVPIPDEPRLARLKKTARRQGMWEIDFGFEPVAVNEDPEGPVLPLVFLGADRETGLFFPPAAARLEDHVTVLADHLVRIMESEGRYPDTILVGRRRVANFLKPLAGVLGIRVVRRRRLPLVEEARWSIAASLV